MWHGQLHNKAAAAVACLFFHVLKPLKLRLENTVHPSGKIAFLNLGLTNQQRIMSSKSLQKALTAGYAKTAQPVAHLGAASWSTRQKHDMAPK